MNIGDRVTVNSDWSTMYGWTGTVTERLLDGISGPWWGVTLDKADDIAIPFAEDELLVFP